MYWVYILKLANNRFYIGQTQNLEARVFRHQTGQNKYTKPHRPIVLVHKEQYSSRSEAVKRERYLKSLKSRQYIEQLIKTADGPIV